MRAVRIDTSSLTQKGCPAEALSSSSKGGALGLLHDHTKLTLIKY